jgi:DnaJ-class molecular chaperone
MGPRPREKGDSMNKIDVRCDWEEKIRIVKEFLRVGWCPACEGYGGHVDGKTDQCSACDSTGRTAKKRKAPAGA